MIPLLFLSFWSGRPGFNPRSSYTKDFQQMEQFHIILLFKKIQMKWLYQNQVKHLFLDLNTLEYNGYMNKN